MGMHVMFMEFLHVAARNAEHGGFFVVSRKYMAQIELQKGFHSNMARLSNYI